MSASVRCLDCASFSFQRVPAADARLGIGHCQHRAPFIRHSATLERDCQHHAQESQDVVKARREWLGRQGNNESR